MDIARARYLASPAGRAALAELPPAAVRADPNKLVSALRKSYPPAEASALSEQAILIARAAARFGARPDVRRLVIGIRLVRSFP